MRSSKSLKRLRVFRHFFILWSRLRSQALRCKSFGREFHCNNGIPNNSNWFERYSRKLTWLHPTIGPCVAKGGWLVLWQLRRTPLMPLALPLKEFFSATGRQLFLGI